MGLKDWHNTSIFNNRGKTPAMRPKHCVSDTRNGRRIMHYYNHDFVTNNATQKTFAETRVFIR